MNWEALGATAELLGAVAVFATLVYLSLQVRQSNIVTREQAHYHMLQNQIGHFDRLATDLAFVKTVYGEHLSEGEARDRQHEAHTVSILLKWNWEFLRVQDGIYPASNLPLEGLRWSYKTIGIDRHWEEKKTWLDAGFVEFMESEIIPHAVDA